MISSLLETKKQSFVQIFKFVSIGALNTAIDFLVLNVLIFLFGTGLHGELYIFFKAISFILAVVNSYIFNKYWVFTDGHRSSKVQEGFLFFVISGIGFLLNVSISSGVFFFLSVHTSFGHALEANIGAVVGSILVLAWNFVGYKLIVFKK